MSDIIIGLFTDQILNGSLIVVTENDGQLRVKNASNAGGRVDAK